MNIEELTMKLMQCFTDYFNELPKAKVVVKGSNFSEKMLLEDTIKVLHWMDPGLLHDANLYDINATQTFKMPAAIFP